MIDFSIDLRSALCSSPLGADRQRAEAEALDFWLATAYEASIYRCSYNSSTWSGRVIKQVSC